MSISPYSESSFIYLDAAQALNSIGDAQALHGMLAMLQDLLARELPQIGQLMQEKNFPAAQLLLHSLKGCLPIFCTPDLCEELVRVEQMSKSSEREASEAAYTDLRPKLECLLLEIGQHLDKQTGG